MLESEVPLSSLLEEVLYESPNEWVNVDDGKMRLVNSYDDDDGDDGVGYDDENYNEIFYLIFGRC